MVKEKKGGKRMPCPKCKSNNIQKIAEGCDSLVFKCKDCNHIFSVDYTLDGCDIACSKPLPESVLQLIEQLQKTEEER